MITHPTCAAGSATSNVELQYNRDMMNNTTEPIIGAQYEWQGMPCAIVDVESKYRWLNFYEHLVTVEYFNKDVGQWRRVKTPWLSGAFKLTLAPARVHAQEDEPYDYVANMRCRIGNK